MKRLLSPLRLVTVVVLVTALSLGAMPMAAYPVTYRAKWNVRTLGISAEQGAVRTTRMTFTATANLTAVKLSVSPSLRSSVRLSPTSIRSLRKGKKVTVTVRFAPSATTTPGAVAGYIYAKRGTANVAAALRVSAQTRAKGIAFGAAANQQVAASEIGATGGTISAPAGSPLAGVQVTFPPGALAGTQNVTLGFNTGTLVPTSGQYSGFVLNLNTGTDTQFDRPVQITVPFNQPGKIPLPYYVTPSGQLQPAQLVAVDTANGTFTFETFHASWYTWLFGSLTDAALGAQQTGYVPNKDGFQIVNTGSAYNRAGECFGMTSFSLWYFATSKALGDFYPKWMTFLATGIRGQNVIATRSFISIAQQWDGYYSNLASRQQGALSQEARYLSIVNAIKNTGKPVMIYLAHDDNSPGAHSVLAYGYNNLTGVIDIYDPNFPGQRKTIGFDFMTKTFRPYSGFDFITYSGDGSLHLTEAYGDILDDAKQNFRGSDKAQIKNTVPANRASTTDRNVTFRGTVYSGSVRVEKIAILVGSTRFEGVVDSSRNFSIPISLESGVNHLKFETKGRNADGRDIVVPNNMDLMDYRITLNSSDAAMLVTLTWNTGGTDIDLYVTDPGGDTSWYSDKTTADGGELDFDDTSGYGPEHWTLLNSDTVRYGQPYKIGVHYYSDHQSGATIPTNFTVTVLQYEGTSRQRTTTYQGSLAAESTSNDDPGSTGGDWFYLPPITLTEQ